MDNGFFETMTNEIFNDNNPNVEKKSGTTKINQVMEAIPKVQKKSLSYMQLPTIVQINEVLL
jgi:hypothetical protein